MPLLENRIAVVTGAAGGIGRAIATAFAREGARVVLLDLDADAAAREADDIRAAGGDARAFGLDVASRPACFEAAARVAAEVGPVSVLVNNAGIARRNAFTADPEAVWKDWQDVMAINADGVFNVTHAFLPALRATRGRVVNIGSIQSFVHVRTPSSVAYTASKHAVLGLTKAMAVELAKDGVRVNAIGPGLIETPMNAQMRSSRPEVLKAFLEHTPLGRTGQPDEIAGPALFLASDLSSYVTGSIVMVDGGYRAV
jgi:NAD(P)-dependent dehydrogenase (short-subunit alcohol dehydrogenase family)